MRILRFTGVAFALVAAVIAAVAIAARFSDGPIGPLPGGALIAGELVIEPVTDWSFAESIPDVELQLYDPDRSRRVWILVRDGAAYIPCGLPNFRLWKQWPHQAMADPRALIRIDNKRYPVDLRRVEDPAMIQELGSLLASKYDSSFGGEVWYFELTEPEDG